MIGRLVVDYEEVNLGDLLEFLTDKGVECCVDGETLYVYETSSRHHTSFLMYMKRRKYRDGAKSL